jgi:integrase
MTFSLRQMPEDGSNGRDRSDPDEAAAAAAVLNRSGRIVGEAWRQNDEWGLYIWLAMVTGARRGELLALRWCHLDLDDGVLTIQRRAP